MFDNKLSWNSDISYLQKKVSDKPEIVLWAYRTHDHLYGLVVHKKQHRRFQQIQRFTSLGVTGVMQTNPTAALEVLLATTHLHPKTGNIAFCLTRLKGLHLVILEETLKYLRIPIIIPDSPCKWTGSICSTVLTNPTKSSLKASLSGYSVSLRREGSQKGNLVKGRAQIKKIRSGN